MNRQRPASSKTHLILEQIALLFTSFVWTVVILTGIGLFWAFQDTQARWKAVLGFPEPVSAGPVAAAPPAPATSWPGPGATPVPPPTTPPTATPTLVLQPPEVLPDTPNIDDPTPIPVIVHTQEEAAEFEGARPVEPAPTVAPTPAGQVEARPASTGDDVAAAVSSSPTPAPAIQPSPAATGPTRLVIPAIGLDSSVIPVGWRVVEQNGRQFSIWEVADFAVGWHQTSAPPGQVGNTVLAGHHNINGEVFRDLVNVEVGDEVTLYIDDQPYQYRIELKTIVKEKGEPLEVRRQNAQWIAPTTDERITMVTCWPFTNNTHRVIVVAKPL